MPVSFSDLQLAFEFVSSGGMGENEAYLDRQSGKILSHFGRPGSFPGQFNQAHGIAVDSNDNIYIAENRGKRILKFKAAGH